MLRKLHGFRRQVELIVCPLHHLFILWAAH